MSTPDLPADQPFELVLAQGQLGQSQLPRPHETPTARGDSPGIALAAARVPGSPTLPDPAGPGLTALVAQLAGELFAAPVGLAEPSAPSAIPAQSAPSAVPAQSTLPAASAVPAQPSVPTPGGAEANVPPAPLEPSPGAGLGSSALGGSALGSPASGPFDAPLDFGVLDGLGLGGLGSSDTPSALSFPLVPPGAGTQPTDTSGPYWLGSTEPAQRPVLGIEAFQVEPHSAPRLGGAERGSAFDPHALRREFPILNERVNGKRLVWLDNAATTQKPQSVIDRVSFFYEHENSNIHRAAHTLAARATDAYESARETARKFIGAPSKDNIVFVRGATEGINLVAQAWGRRNVRQGDEILLTNLEHHANIVPWQQLARETGARIVVAPVDDQGSILLEEYERLLSDRTRIVSFTQISNALGTITPAAEMIALAHRHGARVLLDGAQAVSHTPVDVQGLDCDFYVFSGHKVFAPTGIGVVFGKKEVLEAMPPWQGGGNMIQDVTFERTIYQGPPARFEAGTGNIADAAGLGAALDWLMRIGVENVQRYEHELLDYATARLLTVPGLRLIGTSPNKAGVLSFILAGQKTEEVGGILDQEGIAVRSGHHCAQPILRRFGLEATVRASLAPYNTTEDIDALVSALQRLQAGKHAA